MKILSTVILLVIIFLAVSSAITKILLMQRDVDFFGKYGFTDPILIAFGLVQFLGGVLLVFRKTRFVGAALVSITFLISLVLLLIDGNMLIAIVTSAATLFSIEIMRKSWTTAGSEL